MTRLPRIRGALALLVGLIALSAAPRAHAHDNRPLYVELAELETGVFELSWRVPPSVPDVNQPEIRLPAPCVNVGAARTRGSANQALWQCAEGVGGELLAIDYPLFAPSMSTLVRVSWQSGESRTVLAEPGETAIALPSPETASGVARQYLGLGVRHILAGYDHLLFLFCLMLIARTGRRILITVTGFTLAHSVTLALSALGVVRVPIPVVEALIALSIVFVAVELARDRKTTLTHRFPILVSSSFGLLHGFGFAAVLGETGLPQTEIPMALLFFNLGVELGQVAFVLSILAALWLVVRTAQVAARRSPWQRSVPLHGLELALTYAVGILASYWMFQRVAGFWA